MKALLGALAFGRSVVARMLLPRAAPSGTNALVMKTLLTLLVALSIPAFAKDKEITLAEAPAGVQATVKKVINAGATLEKIEIEESGGGKSFGAKITDKNGLRWEIIMDAEGKVTSTDQKKPKKAK